MSVPSKVKQQEEEALKLLQLSQQSDGNTDGQQGQPTPVVEVNQNNPAKTDDLSGGNNIDWEHKYNSLKGKFDAATIQITELKQQLSQQPKPSALEPTEAAELNQLRQSNQLLQRELDSLKSQQSAQEVQLELDPHLVNEYGEDFAKAVANQTSNTIKQVEDRFANQLQSTTQQFQQVSSTQKQTTLAAKLSGEGIDYNAVDRDPAFHQFLSQVDPYSGTQRQQLLLQAFDAGDIERTANFYRTFTQLNTTNSNSLDSNPLSQHINPNTVQQPDSIDTQPAQWTEEQIAQLYRDRREGRISDEDFNRYEQELFNSMNGG